MLKTLQRMLNFAIWRRSLLKRQRRYQIEVVQSWRFLETTKRCFILSSFKALCFKILSFKSAFSLYFIVDFYVLFFFDRIFWTAFLHLMKAVEVKIHKSRTFKFTKPFKFHESRFLLNILYMIVQKSLFWLLAKIKWRNTNVHRYHGRQWKFQIFTISHWAPYGRQNPLT